MIFHNLKIALRNLLKYKTQNIISVVALAVGMVTLAATHLVMNFLCEPAIMHEPYSERCHFVFFVKTQNNNEGSAKRIFPPRGVNITHEIDDILCVNNAFASAEQIVLSPAVSTYTTFTFTISDSTKKSLLSEFNLVEPEYLNFRSMRSAITGEKIPVLKKNEIVLSEYEAKRIFGEKSPIGAQVWIRLMNEYLNHNINYVVRDVYKVESKLEKITPCIAVPLDREAYYFRNLYNAFGDIYEVRLRDGYTIEQFIDEANCRLKNLGIEACSYSFDFYYSKIYEDYYILRPIVYIISSLVLFASLIGFLKMQLQLFNMRRREVALRKIHGATIKKLLALFIVEVGIVLTVAFSLALCIAAWLEVYIEYHLADLIEKFGFVIEGVELSLVVITIFIAAVCVAAVWLVLCRMTKMSSGVAVELHRGRKYTARNIMLGVQLVVGVLFLGGTILLVQLVGYVKNAMNIPANDDYYKRCLLVDEVRYENDNALLLREYLDKRAKGIKHSFAFVSNYRELLNIKNNRELINKIGTEYVKTWCAEKDEFIDFWELDVNWIKPELRGGSYILANEKLYKELSDNGILSDGTLHINTYPVMPVVGTYKSMPYNNYPYDIIIIDKKPLNYITTSFIIAPNDGEYTNVYDCLESEIKRINPTCVSTNIFNMRDKFAAEVHIFENMERGAWILSFVSVVICIMGIYSSISLDTRTRMKEVALRKIHGAKRRDIALLFGRIYLWLFGVVAIVSLPLIILFGNILEEWGLNFIPDGEHLSPLIAIALSFLITLFIVVVIVGYHIRKVMRLNPANIIVKE